MTRLRDRVLGFFIAPAPAEPGVRESAAASSRQAVALAQHFAPPVAPVLPAGHGVFEPATGGFSPVASAHEQFAAVVAAPEDLAAAAGLVAARLRRAAGVRTAVVCRPGPVDEGRPCTPAAAAIARRLGRDGFEAAGAGTLCRLVLPPDPAEASSLLHRLAAVAEVPVVLALPGRLDGFDGILGRADRLHLAVPRGADPALAELALASLAALGPPATLIEPPRTPVARHAAALGLPAGGAGTSRGTPRNDGAPELA